MQEQNVMYFLARKIDESFGELFKTIHDLCVKTRNIDTER